MPNCVYALSGRKVFFGDRWFSLTHGLNISFAEEEQKQMLYSCESLRKNKVDYFFVLEKNTEPKNPDFSRIFKPVYSDKTASVYKSIC